MATRNHPLEDELRRIREALAPDDSEPPEEVVRTRELVTAIGTSLLRVGQPARGYVTGRWSGGVLRELAWPFGELNGKHATVVQGENTHGGQIDGAALTPDSKKIDATKPIARVEIRATESDDAIAVGGPFVVTDPPASGTD